MGVWRAVYRTIAVLFVITLFVLSVDGGDRRIDDEHGGGHPELYLILAGLWLLAVAVVRLRTPAPGPVRACRIRRPVLAVRVLRTAPFGAAAFVLQVVAGICLAELLDEVGVGWVLGFAGSMVLTGHAVRFGVRSWNARVETYADELVDHQVFHTRSWTRDAITGFEVIDGLVLVDPTGYHQLAVGAVFDTGTEAHRDELETWRSAALRPVA